MYPKDTFWAEKGSAGGQDAELVRPGHHPAPAGDAELAGEVVDVTKRPRIEIL